MIVQDYLSKRFDIIPIINKTFEEPIKKFKTLFVTDGIPKVIISNNVLFSSFKRNTFAKQWNFEFKTTTPRYPQSYDQIAKIMIKKYINDKEDLKNVLLEFADSRSRYNPVTNII